MKSLVVAPTFTLRCCSSFSPFSPILYNFTIHSPRFFSSFPSQLLLLHKSSRPKPPSFSSSLSSLHPHPIPLRSVVSMASSTAQVGFIPLTSPIQCYMGIQSIKLQLGFFFFPQSTPPSPLFPFFGNMGLTAESFNLAFALSECTGSCGWQWRSGCVSINSSSSGTLLYYFLL